MNPLLWTLWFWAPQLHLPLSGNVAQRIEPDLSWFFDAIPPEAGDGKVEKKAFEAASYGKQLGQITEVLLDLAEQIKPVSPEAKESLKKLHRIRNEIEGIKKEEAALFERQVNAWLRKLKTSNEDEYQRIRQRLLAALGGEAD